MIQRSFVKRGDLSCASAAALCPLGVTSSDLSRVGTIRYINHIDPVIILNNPPNTGRVSDADRRHVDAAAGRYLVIGGLILLSSAILLIIVLVRSHVGQRTVIMPLNYAHSVLGSLR
jgi:hypothetical protein